jgi:hypothetical protein
MKKILIIFYLLLSFTDFLYAQCWQGYEYDIKEISDLDKRELTGRVEAVVYTHYQVIDRFGTISKGPKTCEQKVIFNQDGTVRKITDYDSLGNITNVDIHEYENGEITLLSHYNSLGKLLAKTAYIKAGKDIREQRYLADGTLNDSYVIRTYDAQGRMVKEVRKDHSRPEYSNTYEYYYDSKNRVIKFIEEGRVVNRLIYQDPYLRRPSIKERFDIKASHIVEIQKKYEYDSKQNITKKYHKNNLSYIYEYEYDKKDNWIKKIRYKTEAKIPDEIIERQITYFE